MSRRLLLWMAVLATSFAAVRSVVPTDSTNGAGTARADVKSTVLTLDQLCAGGVRIVDDQDVMGKLHFPGYSPEAARFLIRDRNAKGIGIDTLSIDYGLSRDFAVHHAVNGAGRYGLENVAQLDQLPPRGFYVAVAPIKIETGSGGPARIFAFLSR